MQGHPSAEAWQLGLQSLLKLEQLLCCESSSLVYGECLFFREPGTLVYAEQGMVMKRLLKALCTDYPVALSTDSTNCTVTPFLLPAASCCLLDGGISRRGAL